MEKAYQALNQSETKKITDYEKKIDDWYATNKKALIEKNATLISLTE